MADTFDKRRIAALVVEDEPPLLLDAVDMVEDAGFTAYGAPNADEAIVLVESSDGDVDMPGSMDGLRLAHAVRDRWPPISIIVVSGHVKVLEETMADNSSFFPKPYPRASVLRALDGIAGGLAGQGIA